MRYLVYLLILANLVFFLWYPRPQPQDAARVTPRPPPPGVEQLVLLSESGKATRPDRAEPPPPAPVAKVPPPVPEVAEAPPPVEEVAPPAPEPVAQQPVEKPVEKPVEEPPPSLLCHTFGPLQKQQEALALVAVLTKENYRASVRSAEVREQAGYKVFLRADSAAHARLVVAELEDNGMKDYFVGKRNYIALGIFSDQSKAQARQQFVRKLGYDAQLNKRYKTRTRHWVDIEETGQALLGSAVWQGMQNVHPEVALGQVDCE